ncbi:mdm2-binding protein isoform X2 [Dunckerocampus dactyliophorus]|uniref:mdm2-binding protein isoform X2 n=1 Tax=Dunckerocampus dactyliophorus TaxID=161453 RepID=UPI0024055E19|nr:mdm2-binding protein isoform X2 [Dunckerocampus dactyliophorus]
MDRYVLVLSLCQTDDKALENCKCPQQMKLIYDQIVDFSSEESARGITVLPACSLSGKPSLQRWYFAVQACHGATQFCSSDWDDLAAVYQRANSEEEMQTALEMCVGSLSQQEELDQKCDQATLTELLEEAAEGLHTLSNKLPPPGKALLDVLVLGAAVECPALKDLLPLLGALRHMSCWHSAKITVITERTAGWRKTASYLSAGLVESAELKSCIDPSEMWRGGLVVREKKYMSELRFDGFCLRSSVHNTSRSSLPQDACATADRRLHSEVFQYYSPVLDLLHLVTLSDLPCFLMSNTQLELDLSGQSVKSKLLLDQLKSLRGKVGALFSLSCVVTPIAQTPASQISSERWRESLARRPKSLPIPDVDVKGESAHYFLLVQGSDNIRDGVCTVKVLHSDTQINGAAAMATVSGMLGQKLLTSSGTISSILYSLPCLQGDSLLRRERKVTQVQTQVLIGYLGQKEQSSTSIPSNDLKVILNLAKEQYLRVIDATLSPASSLPDKPSTTTNHTAFETMSLAQSIWPERSVLHNIENLQKRRQKRRFCLLAQGSSDSLLGPKDFQKGFTTFLDAKELLRHFTLDGKPTSDLLPLGLVRGPNVFQLSPDLSPRRASQMSFKKALASNYHGIEYCLDNQQSLERDRAFVRLQSRLIRYETQTTCCKEPSALPFALSPALSPAVMSEPGSVPDGESLQNADVARLKRRSWDTDGYPRKRLAKSESSDSLCSQSSGSSGTHPAIRSLRQQASRAQSVSSSTSSSSAARRTSSGLMNQSFADKHKTLEQKSDHGVTDDKSVKESRSQKHNRMLQEVVAKTLKHHGISAEHKCFEACSKRLFDISKFYLKDLKTSRGLHDEMKKAVGSNVKQVTPPNVNKFLLENQFSFST